MVSRMVRIGSCLFLSVAVFSCGVVVSAAPAHPFANQVDEKAKKSDTATKSEPPARAKRTQRNRVEVSEEVERQVLEMVQLHLPDIQALLDRLRDKEPERYAFAIRDLGKSVKRLQAAERRGPEALELEVAIVKAQSSINLLIARLKLRDSDKDRDSLMTATRKLEAAELARLDFDVRQLRARVRRMQEQLEVAEKRFDDKQTGLEKQIRNDYQNYLRKAGQK
ncbi:MAG: hypothetical protein AAGJ83_02385 [Planctomycetota bacterium]